MTLEVENLTSPLLCKAFQAFFLWWLFGHTLAQDNPFGCLGLREDPLPTAYPYSMPNFQLGHYAELCRSQVHGKQLSRLNTVQERDRHRPHSSNHPVLRRN